MIARTGLAQVFGFVAVALLAASVARADDAADAKSHYQKATAHYAVGEYHDAAVEYENAYKAKQDPALLYNAAQSHRLAGDNQKALLLYKNIVKLHPSSKYAAESKDRIEKLEQAIATTTSPPNSPAPVEAATATAAPAVAAPPASPPVTPVGGAAAPLPAAPTPSPGAAPAPTQGTLVSAPTGSDTPPPVYQRWWFWAGAGAVVVVAVVATFALSGSAGAWSNVPDVHAGVRP